MGKKKSGLYLPDNGRRPTSGRRSTNEVSFDGKSFHYRDPYNEEHNNAVIAARGGDSGSAEDNKNQFAREYMNPLYDYSYGQVRDAAKDLNIRNVNSQGEVDDLLERLRERNTRSERSESADTPTRETFTSDNINEQTRDNTNTELEIPSSVAGDNSISSTSNQENRLRVNGDYNRASQGNSTRQDVANNFLDQYRLNLGRRTGLDLN
jgi:hypothetical protein